MKNTLKLAAPISEEKSTGAKQNTKAPKSEPSATAEQFETTQSGSKIKKSIANCEEFVRFATKLRKNTLLGVIEINGAEIADEDVHRFRSMAEKKLGFTPSADYLGAAISNVACENAYDPLTEHVNALPKHDGVPRLDSAFERYLGAHGSQYVRSISRKFFVSLIARALQPGCKVDTVLVLEGIQGAGKSTWAKILGGAFYKDLPMLPGEKDTLENMRGLWVIELGELDGLSKADIAKTKRFISVDADRYRPSYGRFSVNVPRRSVFIGTSNDGRYLKDATGARRYWPLRVGTIDNAAFADDREQLLAEAKAAFEAGEAWHLTDAEAIAEQQAETEARFDLDPWEERIARWLRNDQTAKDEMLGLGGIKTETLCTQCLMLEYRSQNTGVTSRVRAVMTRLGYEYLAKRAPVSREVNRIWIPKDQPF